MAYNGKDSLLWKIISDYMFFQRLYSTYSVFKAHISCLKLFNNSILSCIISASTLMKFLEVLMLQEVTDKQHFLACNRWKHPLQTIRSHKAHTSCQNASSAMPKSSNGPSPAPKIHSRALQWMVGNNGHLKRCHFHTTFSVMDACKLHRNQNN